MYGRVYTCFVQLGLSQNLGQEKQGGGGTLQNVCYPAMCIPLCGIFFLQSYGTRKSNNQAKKTSPWNVNCQSKNILYCITGVVCTFIFVHSNGTDLFQQGPMRTNDMISASFHPPPSNMVLYEPLWTSMKLSTSSP